jgi:PEP-CTERM motif
MRPRHLMTAILFVAFAAPALQAGPIFTILAGAPPGQGGEFGNLDYEGPNQVRGPLVPIRPSGIIGTNTPLNSGNFFEEDSFFLSVNPKSGGNFGFVFIDSNQRDFTGVILDADIGPTGGTALVEGTIGPQLAEFFGVDPSVEYGGTLQLTLAPPPMPGGIGNTQGTADFTFAIPEPSSLILMGSGMLAVMAYGRRLSRPCKPGTPAA